MNKQIHRLYISFFYITTIATVLYLAVVGIEYYLTPLSERFWNSNHTTLKPSGFIGHGAGIIGSFLMTAGVVVYMLRKRVRKFIRMGLLKHWLELHIFLCVLGPLLIIFHTAFKFGGLVAVSFWSMIAVAVSGVIGRFIYIQIPRSIQGKELDIKELDEINNSFTNELVMKYNLNKTILLKIDELTSHDKYRNLNFGKSLSVIVSEYFHSKKILTEIKAEVKSNGNLRHHKKLLSLIKEKIKLSRRIGMLRLMQKLFKYWHVAHVPFAIIMFIIMFVHIFIAITFGYTWIF